MQVEVEVGKLHEMRTGRWRSQIETDTVGVGDSGEGAGEKEASWKKL